MWSEIKQRAARLYRIVFAGYCTLCGGSQARHVHPDGATGGLCDECLSQQGMPHDMRDSEA